MAGPGHPPGDCSQGCHQNYISLMPTHAKYVNNSCHNFDNNLRFSLTLAAAWNGSGECVGGPDGVRAVHAVTVRTFRDTNTLFSPLSTAHSYFTVYDKPEDQQPSPPIWGSEGLQFQLSSIAPTYIEGGKKIRGIPVPNDSHKQAWVVVDIDAPRTVWHKTGEFYNSAVTGGCTCAEMPIPCACPGLIEGCGEGVEFPNIFINPISIPNVLPWKAPTDNTADSCCEGCLSTPSITTVVTDLEARKREYAECQVMYKGEDQSCSESNFPSDWYFAPFWAPSLVYQCGMSFNFWIRAHDNG